MGDNAYDSAKRLIDLAFGSVALVLSAPLQLVLACLVKAKLGSPVLFRQERPGKEEEIFELVKFRTMLEPDLAKGLVTDAERMTKLGSWLRATSLDELPTLWNVVKGDMSLVGPRPLLVDYLDRYSPEERRRHEVRPGLTGLVQISGRNALDWPEKFSLDLRYVAERSLRLDVAIIVATVPRVLRRHGIAADGEATMPEFLGENGGRPVMRTPRADDDDLAGVQAT
jgi:lipopolysaccharide/colanic/teichoic acid biosynthesis glycosyltransferase